MCMDVYVRVRMCVHMYACVCIRMSVYVCMHVYGGVCMCMYVYVCVYVCTYVCMCMYVCILAVNSLHARFRGPTGSSGWPRLITAIILFPP